ncbi:tRNA 2-thiouridine(34) synthase MnmA [Candidatus Cytomitobacter primus]|uniref:tRNA-specific 2-thiouridylase MnmA n=1 Tax=Candidatus Cytomitobacter primus TaxID=2066024 RepID=A0A5C0UEX8_9PROT|nr:tRNA 2-thiouridine(34) synthase MnmA [Candidatus Cytomitobacter primus]QEK38608.1 tRNA 2-thiouridine(34) synthase MnmA [Candidatus Cytomitobacter primus]
MNTSININNIKDKNHIINLNLDEIEITSRLNLSQYIKSLFPKGSKIVAAMSGGVDSSVTAALMIKAGYDVVGLTLKLHDNPSTNHNIRDAKAIADFLGFEHNVLDLRNEFQEHVLDKFMSEYEEGKTPNPCMRCNRNIKFSGMVEYTKSIGAQGLVTGHYVKRVIKDDKHRIMMARDFNKDQSYFLSMISKDHLPYIGFPLGIMTKPIARRIAEFWNLFVAKKAESQDLCFAVSNKYYDVLKNMGTQDESGDIVDLDGKKLGKHNGVSKFTIGQRKGLSLAGGPWFVNKIDKQSNTVIVGSLKDLECYEVYFEQLNLLGDFDLHNMSDLKTKVRGTHRPVPCSVEVFDNGTGIIHLKNPEYGVATGQFCGFYHNEILLGGGYIVDKDLVLKKQTNKNV